MSGTAPPTGSLLPQQFYWDNSTSPQGRLWVGVPFAVDPAFQKMVLDLAALPPAGAWISSTAPIPNGLHFGSNAVSGMDMSKHLELYNGYAGFNVTPGAMNAIVAGTIPLTLAVGGAGVLLPLLGVSNSFPNDATAAVSGGVPLYGLYRNGSQVMLRMT